MTKLIEKILRKEAKVGVIGLGYVGLPLIIRFGEAGFPLLGFDIDEAKIEALKAGRSYIKHIPVDRVSSFLSSGQMDVTADFERLSEADCVVIC
ncbi:MAG: NAD(P)-binding domain-containing protein, partial [Acidobacteriota bacterium]